MTTAHSVYELALRAEELAPLFEIPGPVLTAYLDIETDADDAPRRNELRWRSLREAVTASDPAAEVSARIDALVVDAHRFGRGLAVIADRERLRWVEHGDASFGADVARWSSLPSVVPLLERRQAQLPHLVVAVDRKGADIELRGTPVELRDEVEGDDDPIHRPHAGGWSQPRFQRRAENTWRANADQVADEVGRLVDEHAVRLVVAGGDVRAVELFSKALPHQKAALVRVAPGADREPVTADEHFEREISDLVASTVAADTDSLLRKLEEELGQHDRAVDGAEAVLAALARGQVEVLLVHDDPDDARRARFGTGPLEVAATEPELRDLGVDDAHEGRLVDVLVRAALGSGSAVRVVPRAAPITDGVAALLRWA